MFPRGLVMNIPMDATPTPQRTASLSTKVSEGGVLTLAIAGRLDVTSTGPLWREATRLLHATSPTRVVVDASRLTYCDMAGIGLLVELRRRQQETGGELDIGDLPEAFQHLLELFEPDQFTISQDTTPAPVRLPEEVGQIVTVLGADLHTLITFVGELSVALLSALRHPQQVRWKDAFLVAELAGVNALPIVALIGVLTGIIIAFESVLPMRQFGAEIFVADLVGLSILRELGPLMTTIILAGRTGSAFAAELGTMKVNEELDALTTMGLDPVRFLIVTRVIAVVCMTPLLTAFADLFGILVAGVGCLRGLQTGMDAQAVGMSTTHAVVSGIILMVITDGLFTAVYYYIGM